jgi:hypothetical protein
MILNLRDRFVCMYSIHLPLKKQDIDFSNEAKSKRINQESKPKLPQPYITATTSRQIQKTSDQPQGQHTIGREPRKKMFVCRSCLERHEVWIEVRLVKPKLEKKGLGRFLRGTLVRIGIRLLVYDYTPHHALVEKIECEASSRQSKVVTFENTQCLAEKVRLVELFRLFGFEAANSQSCEP